MRSDGFGIDTSTIDNYTMNVDNLVPGAGCRVPGCGASCQLPRSGCLGCAECPVPGALGGAECSVPGCFASSAGVLCRGMRRASHRGMGAKTFEELRAWQLAAKLSDEVVAVCATPALQGDVDFRNQLREAAEAAPRLIAGGFGRWGHREFARYLRMARAELMEVRSDLLALQRRHTIPAELAAELLALTEQTTKTVSRLRSSLD